MSETGVVKGFKVFNPDWTCRGKQYSCPGKFEERGKLSVCNKGMHFCKKAADCFVYYKFSPDNHVAEVIAYGTVAEDGNKCCTDKLEIVREIPWDELLEIVNTGKGCTGLCNSGNCNSGDHNSGNCNSGDHNSGNCNSGNRNSGDWNSGNRNSGDWNSGNCNSGNCNSGDHNSGNCNSGNCNSGDRNSGNRNSGDWNSGNCNSGNRNSGNCNSGDHNSGNCNSGNCNSGDRNSGNRNSGDWNSGNCNSGNCNSGNCNSGDRNSGNRNSGDWNSGDRNSGDRNSGNRNSGDWNSGNRNSGNRNSGDWNKCSFSNGCFNTVEPKIYLFNKPSDWTYRDWLNSDARYLLNQIPGDVLEYVWFEDMTDEEEAAHPEAETTGGYLKILDNSECAVIWWRGLSDRQKAIITAIPNFDKAIFKEITGIDVDAD